MSSNKGSCLIRRPRQIQISLTNRRRQLYSTQRECYSLMRGTVCFSSSFCYHFPIIPHDLPVQRIGIQIGKVIPVLDFHCQLLRIGQCRFDILILLLHFNEMRMRFAGCIDQPVTTEIAKAGHILRTIIPTITPIPFTILIYLAERLIHPIPDTTSLNNRFGFEYMHIFL